MPDLKGKPSVLLLANNLSHNCTSNKYLVLNLSQSPHMYCIKSLCNCTVCGISILSDLLINNFNTFSTECLVENSHAYVDS